MWNKSLLSSHFSLSVRILCLPPYALVVWLSRICLSRWHCQCCTLLLVKYFLKLSPCGFYYPISKSSLFVFDSQCSCPVYFFCLFEFPSELSIAFCKNYMLCISDILRSLNCENYALFSHKTCSPPFFFSFFTLGSI